MIIKQFCIIFHVTRVQVNEAILNQLDCKYIIDNYYYFSINLLFLRLLLLLLLLLRLTGVEYQLGHCPVC